MADEGQLTKIARQRAGATMDAASAAMVDAADKIAEHYGIPNGIQGMTRAEVLGRTTFVVSLQRALKVAAEQHIATEIMRQQTHNEAFDKFEAPPVEIPAPEAIAAPPGPALETKATQPVPPVANDALDLGELPGITHFTVKSLKQAGYTRIADVKDVPDEHLLAVNGVAKKSLGQLRAAITAYLG